MLDKNLLLRDGSTNLTANESAPASKDFGGGDLHPITYMMQVPEAEAATTLDVKIQVSDNDSTWRDFLNFKQVATADVPCVVRVTGSTPSRYRRYVATKGGTISTNGFGHVLIAPELGGEYESY